jgi:hypothetical protein
LGLIVCSNADIAVTLEKILGLHLGSKGALRGLTLGEALKNGSIGASQAHILRSQPAANGFQTILNLQTVGAERYFDAAGAPGRTLGLTP